MIEDDFDKMVRRMFEQLFQASGMFPTIRDNQIRMQNPQNRQNMGEENTVPRIEKIILQDRMLVLIDNLQNPVTPIAKVSGTEVRVILSEDEDGFLIKLPFPIDADESSILYQNGIIEINLLKSAADENSYDTSEQILKNDKRS